jgi:NAD(P)-dependent dehydrogenase (short-subunit alcohol dehydrogenase family)
MTPTDQRPVAVVTGGTQGIGRSVAIALADAGYRVFALARRPPAQAMPPGIVYLTCDVADRLSIETAFAAIGRATSQIRVLVNNAGIAGSDNLSDASDAMWDRQIETNLNGAYRCTRAALPMLANGSGRVIFIASVLGLHAVPDQVAYVATKHGVVGLARALAQLLAPRGITVNAICPGWVDTAMARQRHSELGIASQQAAASVPTGAISQPDEIAAMVLYLTGPQARNITGQPIVIDGGSFA